MSHNVVETSLEAEGNDKLRTFLFSYQDKLKNVHFIYKLLHENDIDYNELMEYQEKDLRGTLNEIGMKQIVIGRLYNVLKTIQSSAIYKEQNAVSTKVVRVIISSKEENSLSIINKKTERISEIIQNIRNEINNLDKNNEKNKQIIKTNFDQIIQAMNDRKNELLLQLDTTTNIKKEVLLKEMNEFTKYQNELNECNDKSQKMIDDLSMDPQNRKIKILTNTKNVLNKVNAPNIDQFKIIKNDIKISIDINEAIAVLLKIGNIESHTIENECKEEINLISNIDNSNHETVQNHKVYAIRCCIDGINCGYLKKDGGDLIDLKGKREQSLFEFIECDKKENKWYIKYKCCNQYKNYWLSYDWSSVVSLYKSSNDRAIWKLVPQNNQHTNTRLFKLECYYNNKFKGWLCRGSSNMTIVNKNNSKQCVLQFESV